MKSENKVRQEYAEAKGKRGNDASQDYYNKGYQDALGWVLRKKK